MSSAASHAKVIERVRNSGDRYTEAVYAMSQNYCRAPGCACAGRTKERCVDQATEMVDWLVTAGYEDALRMMREEPTRELLRDEVRAEGRRIAQTLHKGRRSASE